MKDIKNKIENVMKALFQNPAVKCDYDIVCGDVTFKLKNTPAIDAYMKAVETYNANQKTVRCYMCPNGKRAASDVFAVQCGDIFISGLKLL